ncbi:MAG: zinc ribbon domain-containing protein [Xanthomonadales bacterium]|nr:zinc ribbon domain-containing protein [Xanthomonadales bacterium]MCP5474764.1 zinc ribbon domain-containing protein [Rhodanobacteraceae bacterium]
MPIYEYTATDPAQSCEQCAHCFEILARISDPELAQCPNCGNPVKRVISVASVIGGNAHVLKESHFSKHGFTQYKKAGGGVYEKTAGDGPKYISGDE